jgi:glycosyltransferase involved in cell wall biosynthesis
MVMRIGFDAKRALNNTTGLGNYARWLLYALQAHYPQPEYFLYSPKAKSELEARLIGAHQFILPETLKAKLWPSYWRSVNLADEWHHQKLSLFHGLSNEIPLHSHRQKTPTVVTIHDLIFLKHQAQYSFFDRQLYTLKTKYACRHAAKIIAISEETKQDIIDFYKVSEHKIEVIYPAVDASFVVQSPSVVSKVKQRYALPQKYILNVGSFFARKNQYTLIKAFLMIKDKVEEDLVLVGKSGNTLLELQKIIYDQKLTNRVKILTSVSNEDLPAVYSGASLLAYPSLYEGFGMPVLEAQQCGVPVVATHSGAIAEVAGPHSLVIPPTSAEEVAEKMLAVLTNNSLQEKMRAEGLAFSANFSLQSMAAKTMQLYQSIM